MRKAFALLLLTGLAGGCSQYNVAWTARGWYLEKSNVIFFGRSIYAGPMSYDDCEVARKAEASAIALLCVNETVKPE